VITGKREKLGELLGLIETFPNMFPLVEPRPAR